MTHDRMRIVRYHCQGFAQNTMDDRPIKTDGSMILCQKAEIADAIAKMINAVEGEVCTHIGYYDFSGWYYIRRRRLSRAEIMTKEMKRELMDKLQAISYGFDRYQENEFDEEEGASDEFWGAWNEMREFIDKIQVE